MGDSPAPQDMSPRLDVLGSYPKTSICVLTNGCILHKKYRFFSPERPDKMSATNIDNHVCIFPCVCVRLRVLREWPISRSNGAHSVLVNFASILETTCFTNVQLSLSGGVF
jgi:hypothetical protein